MADDERTLPTALFRSTVRAAPGRGKRTATPAPATRYEPAGDLGTGGMGRVERGVDRFLGREVALKRSLSDDPRMLEVLLREAEIAARLHHPSIVTIHDVAYDEAGQPFVVMRLVDGEQLTDVVRGDLVARLQLLPRVLQAVEAVAFAHRQGVVHRDLKPGNILVAELGHTVVIDWGLAFDPREDRDPFAGASVGTPGFMSPEQERGAACDPRADVYALGITLFFVLAGRAPEPGERLVDVEPGVPRDLASIVETARADDPGARYATAEELANELGRFVAGQLVAAHHYGVVARFARVIRRHRVGFAIAALALAGSIVVGAVSLDRVLAARTEAEQAQHREAKRADEILIGQARGALVDPARAIALLDLREVPRDARSWAVTAEAVSRGVAHAWHPHRFQVTKVVALGDGGVVSVATDRAMLRDGRGRLVELARSPSDAAPVGDGFAIASAGRIELFGPDGERRASWPSDGEASLEAAGRWLVSVDRAGLGIRDLQDGTTRVVPGRFRHPATDPTATWVAALETADGIAVIELATGATHRLAVPAPVSLAWSETGARLAALARDRVLVWTVPDWATPQVTLERVVGMIGFVGEEPIVREMRGCARMVAYPLGMFACDDGTLTSFATGRGRFAYAVGASLRVHEPDRTIELYGSPQTIHRIALDDASRYVAVGTRGGAVAVWDLRPRGMPRAVAGTRREVAMLADGTPIVDDGHRLVEIPERGPVRPLAKVPDDMPQVSLIAIGTDYLAIGDPMRQHVRVLRIATGELVRELDIAGYAARGSRELVVRDGSRVVIVDVVTGTRRVVAERAVAVAVVGVTGDDTAAAWTDGHVWWQDAAGRSHEGDAGCVPTGFGARDDGDIDLVCGKTLLRLGDTRTIVAQLDEPIHDWVRADSGAYVVVTASNAVWQVGATRVALLPPSRIAPALAASRFVSADPASGAIIVHDIATGAEARIARLERIDELAITADGRAVVAASPTEVLRWQDPVPADPAAWPAWRDAITNATVAGPAAPIVWR